MAVEKPTDRATLLPYGRPGHKSLDFSDREALFSYSRLPKTTLSPELEKKLTLISGYQSLLRLEVVAGHQPSVKSTPKRTVPCEGRRKSVNRTSMELIRLRRSLVSSPRCQKCRRAQCICHVTIPDKQLEQMTRRFSQMRVRLESLNDSKEPRRPWAPMESQGKAQYRILKTEEHHYKLAFKTCASQVLSLH